MPEKPELLLVFVVSCNLPAIEVSRRIQSRQPFAFLGLDIQTSDGSSNRGSDPNVPGKLGSTGAGQEPGLAQRGWCRYPGCLHGDRRHLELGIFRSTEKKTLLLHQQQEERKRSSDARTKQDFGDGTFRAPGFFFFVLFRLLFPQATRPLPPGKSLTSARLSIG